MKDSKTKKEGRLAPRQILLVGGMLFSLFFGAGNLILPPLLGLQAGTFLLPALGGFLIAGIGLPVLGIIAVALCGGVRELFGRVHPLFASIFIALMYLTIGPFLAIPRTSSTAFEMIRPLLPSLSSSGQVVLLITFSIVFFGIAFALALRPGKLSRILGRFSAPALIVLIIIVVGASLLGGLPLAPSAQAGYETSPLSTGFLSGYQTMDLLAALCFGIVVAANIGNLGVREPKYIARSISHAGLIAGGIMMVIYCGLSLVGLSLGSVLPNAQNGASILAASASIHFGSVGAFLIAAIFLLACLNVCTGLISCCSEYFSSLTPRISQHWWAALFAILSCALSLIGLDKILLVSAPLLEILYPPAIVVVVMGMFHRHFDKLPATMPCAVLLTTLFSVLSGLRDALVPSWHLPLDSLPFATLGFGWIGPCLIGIVLGAFVSGILRKRSKL